MLLSMTSPSDSPIASHETKKKHSYASCSHQNIKLTSPMITYSYSHYFPLLFSAFFSLFLSLSFISSLNFLNPFDRKCWMKVSRERQSYSVTRNMLAFIRKFCEYQYHHIYDYHYVIDIIIIYIWLSLSFYNWLSLSLYIWLSLSLYMTPLHILSSSLLLSLWLCCC